MAIARIMTSGAAVARPITQQTVRNYSSGLLSKIFKALRNQSVEKTSITLNPTKGYFPKGVNVIETSEEHLAAQAAKRVEEMVQLAKRENKELIFINKK